MTSTARYGNPARILGYARSAIAPSIAPSAVFSRIAPPSSCINAIVARILAALHPADNFVDQRLVRIIAIRREPSMRPDAGLPAERVDLEAAVVGQRRNSRALEVETRLDQRVLGERRSRLLGSLGNSELDERHQFE